jgi:UDP-N-acetylglucosamine diphosphorylase / glucose-1-phosphate thymidylyltransferase / UDP-N-acetylgalactosamine diphosphorylase / glucosamine-1-phosphate N-acetyltransferase / galactosamine-1-phosphate N-acetyltransferase
MQVVILAAGRGTRMGILTDNCPKPMLKVSGKNLLEYKLEALPKEIDEVIFVVGYLKDVIIDYFGSEFTINNRKFNIKYVEQITLNGTMGSLALCKDVLKDKFMVLMGDDIYDKSDLQNLCLYDNAILAIEGDNLPGKIISSKDMYLVGIKEGYMSVGEGLEYINCGAYILDKNIFEQEMQMVKLGEYGLPHTIVQKVLDSKGEYKVKVVLAKSWIQITDPESISLAENLF